MNDSVIFLNVGWMKNYNGMKNDSIEGGGAYVEEHGYGAEMFNFKPYRGYYYGYSSTPRGGQLNINKLGASNQDKSVEGVLVVWVSKKKSGGVYIVGWYSNATVFRQYQEDPPKSRNRQYRGKQLVYNTKALVEDSKILEEDERTFSIKWSARSVWYAQEPQDKKLVRGVLDYINKHTTTLGQKEFEKRQLAKAKKAEELTFDKLKKRIANSSSKPIIRRVLTAQYERNPYISEYVKQRAKGKCELCT